MIHYLQNLYKTSKILKKPVAENTLILWSSNLILWQTECCFSTLKSKEWFPKDKV